MVDKTIYDVSIIGSGPAGYTAALYTSRAFLKTLMLSGIQPGGQLTTTTEIDNFPGFPKGIQGTQLMLDMKAQVERFGTEIKQLSVAGCKLQEVSGKKKQQLFTVRTAEEEFQTKTLIIATGASAKYLGLDSEKRLMGKGVSACATCDGFFFRGKEVVVAGGGDTAMEEANFLTTFSPKVTIIHRRDEFRASAIMLDRAKKNPKISFLVNKEILEVVGDTSVTGVRIKDTKTSKEEIYPAQGFFLAIGHKPNTDFLKGFVALDEKGYIKISNMKFQMSNKDSNVQEHFVDKLYAQTQTSVPGVFAAGDCVDVRYRQAIVAAGQGCMAAMDAQKYLEELG